MIMHKGQEVTIYNIIPCSCGDDIDNHAIGYNELTGEIFSGQCLKCKCPGFRFLHRGVTLSTSQVQRLGMEGRIK